MKPLVSGAGVVVGGVLPGYLVGSLATRIDDDFTFGGAELGLAVAAYNVVSMVGSVPAGRLVDRIGAPAGLRLAGVSTAVACVLAALAQSPVALVVWLAVAGVGNAVGGPAVIAMLRRAVLQRRHGLAYGAMQAGAPVGSLIAGLALPVIGLTVGWRWSFAGTALLALLAAEVAARSRDAPEAAPVGAEATHGRAPGVWAIAAAAVLASAAAMAMVSFLVVYAVEEGMSETTAGLALVGASIASIGARLAVGMAIDRSDRDPLPAVAAMIAAGAGGFVLIALGGPVGVVAGGVLVGLVGWSWAGAFTHAAVARAPGAPAWATGVMMSGLFAGAVTGPLVVGLLADAERFTAAWAMCAGLALAAGALTWAVARQPVRAGV